jgi:uncharacterized membrane protein
MIKRHVIPPTLATILGAGVTVASIAGAAGFLIGRYPSLPLLVPVHFADQGLPDRWQVKTYTLVLMPVWVQLVLALAFGAIVVILLWRSVLPDDAHAVRLAAEDSERMLVAAEAVVLLSAIWVSFQALGAVELVRLWERGWGGYRWIYGQTLVAAIVASVVVGVRAIATLGGSTRSGESDASPHWRFTHLYFNPKDPALFVPARRGLGWTLNFGRPRAVLLMGVVLAIGIGAPAALVRYLIN